MPYVLSLGLLVLGLVLLAFVSVATYRAVRRFSAVRKQVADDLGDRAGVLGARVAGLRTAFAHPRDKAID
ncbi:membrane protein implicated in regulation of membrane protease activity [Saccharopolyspora lacisalsi]|uniref:Membrane protein implicated in regulation of membrane protease activity n=1 Tax=Halosaccharopolyspora lacisalsi TaxID=1000566 RepID=A0A839DWI5_9PSEU|nr:bacteriophage holin [Halosaccharopolyspora lacisalsi]MBA8823695.1 membrane protein implicated in regulation of membrane protease activity [Halosaccharopolyspora lacisalsi]